MYFKKEVVTIDSSLFDLGVDSLDSTEIIMAIERDYNICIEDNEWNYSLTIKDITELVYNKIMLKGEIECQKKGK